MGNTRNSTWVLQQYRQISIYTTIIKSADRFFYTANNNIWECKLCRCWVATRPTISPTTNVFLPQRMQKAKDMKPWMGCKKASTSRSVNINHSCCKSSCDGKTRAKDRNFGHSSRFKSTRYEPYRQEQHHNESEERRSYNERRRSSSSLLPPRDAFLHVPRVTPPAPINQGEQQTLDAAQSYTHVSIHIEKNTSTVHTMVL